MPWPSRLPTEYAWRVGWLSLVLAAAFAPQLPAATVITGDVTPALPWSASTIPKIGVTGVGTLAVDGGTALLSYFSVLGAEAGSTGTATVTGAGSTWTDGHSLRVGHYGGGELRVEAGGQVSTIAGYFGFYSGSTGTATITGAGSKWTSSSGLAVGFLGSGALRVEAGGELISRNDTLGGEMGSTGAATITGAGSKWTTSDLLRVGLMGSGELRVEAGGQVSSSTGSVGEFFGAGTATITGAGSKWTVNTRLTIGPGGADALTVEDGGHVTAGTLYASLDGLHGDGTIAVTAGAVLDADLQFNAANPAQAVLEFGEGGTLTVTAAGGELGVGYKGVGSLTITEGVTVSSSFGRLGFREGSAGTAMISGAGSTWAISSDLYVGSPGSGALTVEAGGQVSNASGYLRSTATITGPGSQWTNSSWLTIGTGELRVEAGGQVSSAGGSLGGNYGSRSTATITGAGSTWTIDSGLTVGSYGRGALTITLRGLVSVRELTIDSYGEGKGFINMATGGMLALWGDADDSLTQFLELVKGADAIRYWNASLADWAPLTAATLGIDYALQYHDAGDLAGYTLLTVGALPTFAEGDFNFDGRVDGADLLAWQRGNSPLPVSSPDLATWRADFGLGATTPAGSAVPEPEAFALVGLATASLLLGCRSTRPRRPSP